MNTDENKKKIIMLFIALGLILSVIFGVTFSYLAPSINNAESNSTVVFNAGTIAINYENGQNQINASEVLPGWTSIKEFSLTAINNTTISTSGVMNYAIKLIVEKNTFNDGAITYSIEGENVDNNGTIAYVLPNSLKKGASEVILGYGVFDISSDISKGVTHNYTLTMAFPNKTYESQNEDSGKTLSAHIIIANEGESTFSNLTIIDDNNNLNKTMILKNNTEYELPNIASKAGAYFSGWNVESGNATINGNKITINGNASIKANYSSTNKTEFAYTGNSEKFVAPEDGIYKFELWGAQGGSAKTKIGGYGGYSVADIYLAKNQTIYVYIGGAGGNTTSQSSLAGGYNGGGNAYGASNKKTVASGGGATHIALTTGLLNTLSNNLDNLIIVAGGGGGACYESDSYLSNGGSGGGIQGAAGSYSGSGTGGSQISGGTGQTTGSFGLGGSSNGDGTGGGGGLYGGGGGLYYRGGGGGSGYIGNTLLTNKAMYCYNCTESSAETTKTISTTCHSSTPTENCAKEGNGYARITMPEIKEVRNLSTITVVSEELKKVVTIEAEKGVETEISVEGLTNSSLGFKSFEIEKGEATINKTKITPLSDTIVVRIIYEQLVNLEFAYTGVEKSFTIPVSGNYRLETWGAQGGTATNGTSTYIGGYGGYSVGTISLKAGETIYVNVGGAGSGGTSYNTATTLTGGYNGGGKTSSISGAANDHIHTSGGGATHIAFTSGLLKDLNNNSNNIIIVSGAGGGAFLHKGGNDYSGNGGSAGGYIGSSAVKSVGNGSQGLGGSQTEGGKCSSSDNAANCNKDTSTIFGSFGLGGIAPKSWGSSGGAGLYGGGASNGDIGVHGDSGGGGGSSYIGNALLTNKVMYCYNCEESSDLSTKTISTTCHSSTPTENCAKEGNGYAKITLIS